MSKTVTTVQKRAIVIAFVVDALRGKIVGLRNDMHNHWRDVAEAMFHEDAIHSTNTALLKMMENNTVGAFAVESGGSRLDLANQHSQLISTRSLRPSSENLRDTWTYVSFGSETDSDEDRAIGKELLRLWDDCPNLEHQLVVPLLRVEIVKPVEDDPDTCDINEDDSDPDEWQNISLDSYIHSDCRTKKEFANRVQEIKELAGKLYSSTMSAVKTTRTESGVIKKVPQLEPFFRSDEEAASDVASLLAEING